MNSQLPKVESNPRPKLEVQGLNAWFGKPAA